MFVSSSVCWFLFLSFSLPISDLSTGPFISLISCTPLCTVPTEIEHSLSSAELSIFHFWSGGLLWLLAVHSNHDAVGILQVAIKQGLGLVLLQLHCLEVVLATRKHGSLLGAFPVFVFKQFHFDKHREKSLRDNLINVGLHLYVYL